MVSMIAFQNELGAQAGFQQARKMSPGKSTDLVVARHSPRWSSSSMADQHGIPRTRGQGHWPLGVADRVVPILGFLTHGKHPLQAGVFFCVANSGAASDALVGPMWSQHGSVRFEVPVTFLVETLLVNCSHIVRHTHEVHFPHFAGGNVELHNRAWASANHVPIDF